MINEYYVYALIDPRNNQAFYVGKGLGGRAHNHLLPSALFYSSKNKLARIKVIRAEGYEPIITKIYEDLTEEDALRIEGEVISEYGRADIDKDGTLTNVQPGGLKGGMKHSLPEDIIKAIYLSTDSYKSIMKQYNIATATISAIRGERIPGYKQYTKDLIKPLPINHLSEDIVKAIYLSTDLYKNIATQYNISKTVVTGIKIERIVWYKQYTKDLIKPPTRRDNSRGKITLQDRTLIYHSPKSQRALERQYGVNRATIWMIKNNPDNA